MGEISTDTLSKPADTTASIHELSDITWKPYIPSGERIGEWMHTSLGGKFYPADPRPEEIFISDIANGLALDCRYGGQGSVYNYYSVAEHCVHMADYALRQGWEPKLCLAVLLHDAAEAYLRDLPRPVKEVMELHADFNNGYGDLEDFISRMIFVKYIPEFQWENYARVKDLDSRMISHEKAKLMRYQQAWPGTDELEPLEGVAVKCWNPPYAKQRFLEMYDQLCLAAGLPQEEWEI